MKSKLTIFLSSLLSLISPVFVFAAFNDVKLNSDALISISSINLTVQGGNGADIEQVVVNTDTFTPTMPGGSYFKAKSTDRRKFSITPVGSLKITQTCTDTESTLELDNPSDGVSVSPEIGVSSDTCAAGGGGGGGGGGSSGGSSGGGGGGGSGGPALVAATPKYVPVAPIVAQPSPIAMAVSPVFNSDLQKGSRGDDVKRLQELLAKDPSVYPDGSATGFYGSLTEQAVRKFQAKYSLPQVGRVGPATRAKLQEVFGGVMPAIVVPTPVPVVNPVQPVVPPATTQVSPPPSTESLPFWMQLKSSPRAGGASVVDPLSPSSPSSPQTVEEKKAYAEQLPFWMQLTQ